MCVYIYIYMYIYVYKYIYIYIYIYILYIYICGGVNNDTLAVRNRLVYFTLLCLSQIFNTVLQYKDYC